VTDDSHLAVLQRRLEQTTALIERTTAQFRDRHGRPMPDGNVWLVQREAERDALARLLAGRLSRLTERTSNSGAC